MKLTKVHVHHDGYDYRALRLGGGGSFNTPLYAVVGVMRTNYARQFSFWMPRFMLDIQMPRKGV